MIEYIKCYRVRYGTRLWLELGPYKSLAHA